MRLPKAPAKSTDRNDRHILFRNLKRECATSRDQRAGICRQYRTSFLTGTILGQRARYNKLKEHVQESAADLYAPESVQFALSTPRRYGHKFLAEAEVARDDFADLWSDTGADLIFQQLVEWAFVYPTTIGKVVTSQGQPSLVYVEPWDIGVWQEVLPSWQKQEALCHWYTMSIPAYARMIREGIADKERADWLIRVGMEHAETLGSASGDSLPPGIATLISTATPTMVGVVPGLPDVTNPLTPMDIEPVVRLAELWVWDDEAHHVGTKGGRGIYVGDYRVVRMHEPTEEVLYELLNPDTSLRETPLVSAGHPFHPVTLEPVPGLLWGQSPIDPLLALQSWHEDWLGQLRSLFDLNANPPRAAIAISGLTDEKMKILRAPGGDMTIASATGSIENMAPTMPPDGLEWLLTISRMFARLGGRPAQMSSQFDASSRTGEQDLIRAMLGAGPTLTKAMRVEAALSNIATAMWRSHRRSYEHPLTIPNPVDEQDEREFLLAQIPRDSKIQVAAHSHSPVFQQQLMPKIAFAAQMGWIGAKGGLRLFNLPLADELQAEAGKMAAVAAKRGEEIQQNKNLDTRAKVISAQAKMLQAKMP